MPEHVNQWLGAYSDGELGGARLRQVESHLAECAACRAELEQLGSLSSLLHESPAEGEFLPTERFVSNLNLNLPRRPVVTRTRRALEIGWWLVPFAVLGIWVFLQVTISLSALTLNASNSGLLGNSFSWVQAAPPQAEWVGIVTDFFGGPSSFVSQMLLSRLNEADQFVDTIAGYYLWQALLAVIYLGWLASWWFLRPAQLSNSGSMEVSAQ